MKGDFTRDTFGRNSGFYRVLLQQGRVQVDADWNEQISIILHQIETMTVDVFGPHGGPDEACGFAVIRDDSDDLCLSPGRYYVEGLPCENREIVKLGAPPDLDASAYIVYLDVSERYVAAVQDPAIADVALAGLDTAGRSQITWQAKYWPLETEISSDEHREHWMREWQRALRETIACDGQRGIMRARVAASFGFTGAQNQLYRIEVHQGGAADSDTGPTWKWSRDNGSVAFALTGIGKNKVVELKPGPRSAGAFAVGDWVEITSDADREDDEPKRPLYNVTSVSPGGAELGLGAVPPGRFESSAHWIVRRWDQRTDADGNDRRASGGSLPLLENTWLPLESGIEVYFKSAEGDEPPRRYRGGDYWSLPARTATGSIEWPAEAEEGLPPRGVRRRYAPLAGIVRRHGALTVEHDFRTRRKPLSAAT